MTEPNEAPLIHICQGPPICDGLPVEQMPCQWCATIQADEDYVPPVPQ